MAKTKKKCCRKWQKKGKACKNCPVKAQLSERGLLAKAAACGRKASGEPSLPTQAPLPVRQKQIPVVASKKLEKDKVLGFVMAEVAV